MGKLRAVKDRVVESQGEYEFDLRGLDGPILKKSYPVAMLSVAGANTQEVTERARAEGFNVDNDGRDLLIWDSNPSDGGHKLSTTNLFIFVLGMVENLTSKSSLTLFQFDGLRLQLENGIYGVTQGMEISARKTLAEAKTQKAGQIHISSAAIAYLTQAGFTFDSKKNETHMSFSDLRDMKDELRKETTSVQKRSRAA